MTDILHPGETLGPVVTTAPSAASTTPDPDASLLEPGETLGSTVPTPPPSFGSRVFETGPLGPPAALASSIYSDRTSKLHDAMEALVNGDAAGALKKAVEMIPFADPGSPEMRMIKGIATQSINEIGKGNKAAKAGDTAGMIAHDVSAIVPPLAPAIQAGGEDIKNKNFGALAGDVVGGVTQGLAVASGAFPEETSGIVKDAASTVANAVGKGAAKTAAAGAGALADTAAAGVKYVAAPIVKGVVSGAADFVKDNLADIASKAPDAADMSDLAAKTTDYLSQKATDLGLPVDDIQQRVQSAVDKVQDEYTYWFNHPQSVSGGSFDAATSLAKNLQDQFAGPPKFASRLAELAYTEPPAAEVQAALTRGSTTGGLAEAGEKMARRLPGAGPEFEDPNAQLRQALQSSFKNGAYYADYGSRLTEILGKYADKPGLPGAAELEDMIGELNEGLADNNKLASPHRFQNYDAGKPTTNDTATATLWRDALQEAHDKLAGTSKFGGPLSLASSTGLGGVLGLAAGHPILGLIGGVALDQGLKALVRKGFIDPTLPGDSLWMNAIRSVPVNQGSEVLKKYGKQSGTPLENSPAFQDYTPAQKAQAIAADKSLRQKFEEFKANFKGHQGQ
jgi:hypothetical protein